MAQPKAARTAALMASPDDAEAAFYEAMQQGDVARMDAVWPTKTTWLRAPRRCARVGPGAVRASFEALFANGVVDVVAHHVRRLLLGNVAVHHVLERVRVSAEDSDPFGYVLATNVYSHTPPRAGAWWLHHGSPGHTGEVQEIAEARPTGMLH